MPNKYLNLSGLQTFYDKINSERQAKLDTQTAYTAQGSATKVPQITTNSLGQVTGITEVTISGVTPASHVHGNISNTGTLTDTAAAASGNDYVVLRDADDASIRTSTIKGTDVADAVSSKHSHADITLSTTAQAYDGTHTIAMPSSDPYTTARTPTSHTHGNIKNTGALQTDDVAIASGDKLVVTDASDNGKVARAAAEFDGTTTTTALTPKGTFESFAKSTDIDTAIGGLDVADLVVSASGGSDKTLASLSEADGIISATFQDISIITSQVRDFPTAMPPTSHVHGNITNAGHIGSTSGLAVVTTTDGLVDTADLSGSSPSVPSTGETTALAFIDTVSQDSKGKITATKKGVPDATTGQKGVVQLLDSHASTATDKAATPKNVKEAYDLAAGKQDPVAFDGTYDSSTNKAATVATVTGAISALDVPETGTGAITGFGAGKTLASLTETDGKVSATFQDIAISESQVTNLTSDLSLKAPLASPALTGTPTAPTASTGDDSTQIATTAFVQTAVSEGISSFAGALVYKDVIAGGTTGDYGALTPAASCGWTYKVSAAGKIDGIPVEVGDMLICNTNNTPAATSSTYETVAASWDVIQTNLDGVVVGPSSATDGHLAAFDQATGTLIKDSGKSLSDIANDITAAIQSLDGNLNGTTPGAGKTLTAFSETDGVVSATFGDIAIASTQVSGLGTAAGKDVSTSISSSSTDTTVPSSKAVYDIVSEGNGIAGRASFENITTYRCLGYLDANPVANKDTCATFHVVRSMATGGDAYATLNVNIRNSSGTNTFSAQLNCIGSKGADWSSILKLYQDGSKLYIYGKGVSGFYFGITVLPLSVRNYDSSAAFDRWHPLVSNTAESSVSYTEISYDKNTMVSASSLPTGSASTPVFVNSNGQVEACTLSVGDTQVTQTADSSNTGSYPILAKNTTGTSTVTDTSRFNPNVSITPSTGTLNATQVKVATHCLMQYNSTDRSLDFVFV